MAQAKRSQTRGATAQTDDDRRIWQFFTIDQRWICPYCRGAYKVQQNTAQGIRSLIQHHLQRQCTTYERGQGRKHSITEMQHQAHLYNVEYFARNDRAWQVFDHEGYWFSPCSLQRVESVRLNNRRFDSNTVQHMAEHLLACPHYRQGTVHKVEAVQQARDLHAKVISLSRNLQKVIGQKIWQHVDRSNQWVCPYCLDHGPWLQVAPQGDWLHYTTAMAHHLLSQCQVYQTNPRGIRSEREVVAAASGQGPSHGFGGRSPSNPALQIVPMQNDNTPLQTMSLSPVTQSLSTPPRGQPTITPAQNTPHTRPTPILPPAGQPPTDKLPPLDMPPPPPPGEGFQPASAAFSQGSSAFRPTIGSQTPSGNTPISGGQDATTGRTVPQARVVQQGQSGEHRQDSSRSNRALTGRQEGGGSENQEPTIARPGGRRPSGEQPQVAKPLRPSGEHREPSGGQPQVAKPMRPSGEHREPSGAAPRQPSQDIRIGSDDLEQSLSWMPESGDDAEATEAAGMDTDQNLGWMDEVGSQEQAPAAEPLTGSPEEATPSDDLAWMDDMEQALGAEPSPSAGVQEQNTELIRARDVQKNMLKDCPRLPGFHFATRYEPAADVSGDFYDFIELDDGRIGFAMGDVSGHGMGAGLIMSMTKKVFSIYARMGESPQRVLSQVNDALVEDLGGKRFVSITYAILDPDARTITWARAGHNPTLAVNVNTGEYREIKPAGMVVGMKGGSLFGTTLKMEVSELRSGDVFLVYTDGITETMNRQGDEYGPERLQHLLTDHAEKDIDHLLDRIMDSARQFRGGGATEDDITLLGLSVD